MGSYPLYLTDHYDNFHDLAINLGARHGQKPAFVSYALDGTEEVYTYERFSRDIQALGTAFIARGWAGRHIAVLGESSYRYVVAVAAIAAVGGVAPAIDFEQNAETILSMMTHADAEAAIASPSIISIFDEYAEANGLLGAVIALSETAAGDYPALDALIAEGAALMEAGDDRFAQIEIDNNQPALIVYTSGTTSISKPVMLSHTNIIGNAIASAAMVDAGERVYTALPLYHTYGLTCSVLDFVSQGLCICINGSLKTMMRDITLFNPDTIVAVPLMIEALYGAVRAVMKRAGMEERLNRFVEMYACAARFGVRPRCPFKDVTAKIFGTRLKYLISGGAHLNMGLAMKVEALGVAILEGYGITECSPLVSVNRNCDRKLGTVGKVTGQCEIKLVDGEIWVKGPYVMLGYYKDEAQTRAVMQDGYFKTGDIGEMDRNGYLTVSGRKKNLIVFKNGKKVAPEEIENLAASIPLVKESMAYGTSTGESADDVNLALMVYPDPALTSDMSAYEILHAIQAEIDKFNEQQPTYKKIRIVKIRDTEFDKTATRKIKRYSV